MNARRLAVRRLEGGQLPLFELSPTPVDLSFDDVNGRPITTFFAAAS
jgi:hypothetical protein